MAKERKRSRYLAFVLFAVVWVVVLVAVAAVSLRSGP